MQTQSYEFCNSLKKKEEVYLIAWGHSQKFLPFFLLTALLKGSYYLLRYDINVVQLGDLVLSPLGVIFKSVFGKKVLAMAHGKDVAFRSRIYRRVVFNAAKRLDGVVCVSGFLRSRLIGEGFGAERLFVNPNGIDFGKYEVLPGRDASVAWMKENFGVDLGGKKVILSVSRLVRKIGMALFVRNIFPGVVRECPGAVLLLAGDAESREAASEKADMLAFARENGIEGNLFFLGNITDRDVALKRIYSASHVYVMPNRRVAGDFEGFGIVALEASANAVPVVAFDVDGISEAVKDGENGVLIKDNDDAGFAEAVKMLVSDEGRSADMGRCAREFVRVTYDWPVIVGRYMDILDKLK